MSRSKGEHTRQELEALFTQFRELLEGETDRGLALAGSHPNWGVFGRLRPPSGLA
jgi:hypothetical protein